MRRTVMAWAEAPARELLARSRVVHFASTTPEGRVVLRALNGVVVNDLVAFHASPLGEKAQCVGRPAVVSAEETVASIPSYFVDPERACPASTYYRSVQVRGTVREVDDPGLKASVLEAFMQKYQPEGGYVPIAAGHPLYAKSVASLLVFAVPLSEICGRIKVGQHRPPAEVAKVVEGLFRRGAPGDLEAIEAILAHVPEVPRPGWLRGPDGTSLHLALAEADIEAAVDLVASEYWNVDTPRHELATACRRSAAWIGARAPSGELVATARAISDGTKFGWIGDVAVAKAYRGRGVGTALIDLLLKHPVLRDVRRVCLRTADAHGFYARLGFAEPRDDQRVAASSWMMRPGPGATALPQTPARDLSASERGPTAAAR